MAWNDLGMHCMDGDYSVFSILPPFNNLHAQLVDKTNNGIVTQGVTMTYEAMADADGSINSTVLTAGGAAGIAFEREDGRLRLEFEGRGRDDLMRLSATGSRWT